jgi:hypothetical protein
MSEKIKAKLLDFELIGSDTIVFKLEDGTKMKVQVNLVKVARANEKTEDGTTIYQAQVNNTITFLPKDRNVDIPKPPTQPKKIGAKDPRYS